MRIGTANADSYGLAFNAGLAGRHLYLPLGDACPVRPGFQKGRFFMSDAQSQQRLVALMREFGDWLREGLVIPRGTPPDRFEPFFCVIDRDTAAGIVENVAGLRFLADARRLERRLKRFYAIWDWPYVRPSMKDDKGWKEYQRRYAKPLAHEAALLLAVLEEVRDLVGAGGKPRSKNGGRIKGRGGSKPTINGQMLHVLQTNLEARGWTIRKWHEELKASIGGIQGTETWKQLVAARKLMKAEHAQTKHRRSKGRRRTEQN